MSPKGKRVSSRRHGAADRYNVEPGPALGSSASASVDYEADGQDSLEQTAIRSHGYANETTTTPCRRQLIYPST
jgi:hypothetical protein